MSRQSILLRVLLAVVVLAALVVGVPEGREWLAERRAHGSGMPVLFVGNSYTFVNDLPAVVRDLSLSMGVPFEVHEVTEGGATLRVQAEKKNVREGIDSKAFRYVILQGQSAEPVWKRSEFLSAGKELVTRAETAGSVPVLFETWARRVGDPLYKEAWSRKTPEAWQAGVRSGYRLVVAGTHALVAPVGDAWEKAVTTAPNVDCYGPDGSHPSPAGTFLAAAVIVETITGKSSIGAPPPPLVALTADQANTLETIAHETVLAQHATVP